MDTIDVMTPLREAFETREGDYITLCVGIVERGEFAPDDAETSRVARLLKDMGREPERLQYDVKQLQRRREAAQELIKANSLAEQADAAHKRERELRTEQCDLHPSSQEYDDRGDECVRLHSRHYTLIREAESLQRTASGVLRGSACADIPPGDPHAWLNWRHFKPATDAEWDTAVDSVTIDGESIDLGGGECPLQPVQLGGGVQPRRVAGVH